MMRKTAMALLAAFTFGAGVTATTLVNANSEKTPVDAQPNMQQALTLLKQAKESLQKATADKGGHRVKAMDHVDKAIEQVEKGIKFDNKN
jgi:hypothetical protein